MTSVESPAPVQDTKDLKEDPLAHCKLDDLISC